MRIAALGEQTAVTGYALAGALVVVAENAAQAIEAWRSLPTDVAIVVVTEQVAQALQESVSVSDGPMMAVIPR